LILFHPIKEFFSRFFDMVSFQMQILVVLVLTNVAVAEDQCLMALRATRSKKYPGNTSEVLRHSRQLALTLLSAASQPSVTEPTTALLRSFRPCTECKQHRRYGESNDGGYVMCDDDMQLGQLKAAYSYGINGFDGWANAISEKFQIPVFEYDCTNPKQPQKCPTCDLRFNLECINSHSAKPKGNFGTLSQHFQKNGHGDASEGSMLLKIDVEGAEWPVFAEEPPENLKKFREIIVEFHNLNRVSEHPLFLKAVSNILNAGFVVEHIHGNNNGGQSVLGGHDIPNVLEVTYLQRATGGGSTCLDHSTLLPEDAKNNVDMPDVKPAVLPKM